MFIVVNTNMATVRNFEVMLPLLMLGLTNIF